MAIDIQEKAIKHKIQGNYAASPLSPPLPLIFFASVLGRLPLLRLLPLWLACNPRLLSCFRRRSLLLPNALERAVECKQLKPKPVDFLIII